MFFRAHQRLAHSSSLAVRECVVDECVRLLCLIDHRDSIGSRGEGRQTVCTRDGACQRSVNPWRGSIFYGVVSMSSRNITTRGVMNIQLYVIQQYSDSRTVTVQYSMTDTVHRYKGQSRD